MMAKKSGWIRKDKAFIADQCTPFSRGSRFVILAENLGEVSRMAKSIFVTKSFFYNRF